MIDKTIYGFGGMQYTSVCNPLMQCKMIWSEGYCNLFLAQDIVCLIFQAQVYLNKVYVYLVIVILLSL